MGRNPLCYNYRATLISYPSCLKPVDTFRYSNLLGGSGIQLVALEPTEAIEDPNAFVLEKYLEDFIVSNFDSVFKGTLQIHEDAEAADGQQYPTDIGPIDILAVEPKSNSFVVIELKKGRPSDQVRVNVVVSWQEQSRFAEEWE